MRLLYVPNEDDRTLQDGFRRPLEELHLTGHLKGLGTFSLQQEVINHGATKALLALEQVVAGTKPTHILVQHPARMGLTRHAWRKILRAHPAVLIYHEADPYTRWKHPLPRSSRATASRANVAFTVGTGVFASNIRRAGAGSVLYAPHAFEPDRYPITAPIPSARREHTITMVANRNVPRFRGLPGWKERIKFVELMQAKFPSEFKIFGKGWTGPGAMGPIPFDQQSAIIRQSRLTVNWDHFPLEPHYFSNRLPISLAGGSIHFTTQHPGYGEIFGHATSSFLHTAPSIPGLLDKITRYLRTVTDDEIDRSAIKAQCFADASLRQDDVLVGMLNRVFPLIELGRARQLWGTVLNAQAVQILRARDKDGT